MTAPFKHAVTLITCALSLTTACSDGEPQSFQGYVEGEYLYLASPQAGYLQTLDVPRGNRVAAGQMVFAVAEAPDSQVLAEAESRAESARQKLQNIQQPKRPSEIAALEANLHSAQAALRLAQIQLEQQKKLSTRHFVADVAVDAARSAYEQAAAQVDSLNKQLATYSLTLGREAEIRSAQADLAAATAQIEQKRWTVTHKTVVAPAVGEINDTYYQPGEWVPAAAPVASLLPDGRRRLRFFVPEQQLPQLAIGQRIEADCDGCIQPIRATVDFIAAQAEYTPPVIYSRGSREKLVFRVEAVPVAEQAALIRPGLPVDVRLVP